MYIYTHSMSDKTPGGGGGGGVLQISSDGDDQMGAKIKTKKKSLGLPTKPQKIPGPKINPQTIPCQTSEPLMINNFCCL